MYSVYKYNAGATQVDILNDVVALLTGTTDVSTLSASCDKANSSINTSRCVAGWTLMDAAAGTNAKGIKAPLYDDGSKYKPVVIDTNTAGSIFTKVFESWNSTTHVGSNECANDIQTAYNQRINTALGGYLYISASVRHIMLYSYQNSAWGGTSYACPSGCFERTRLSPADTLANNYPPFGFITLTMIGGSTLISWPRWLKADGSDGTGTSGLSASIYAGIFGSNPGLVVCPLSSDKTALHPMLNLYSVMSPATTYWGGDISAYSDIWCTTFNFGTALDERIYNGNTYVLFSVSSTSRIAVRKG